MAGYYQLIVYRHGLVSGRSDRLAVLVDLEGEQVAMVYHGRAIVLRLVGSLVLSVLWLAGRFGIRLLGRRRSLLVVGLALGGFLAAALGGRLGPSGSSRGVGCRAGSKRAKERPGGHWVAILLAESGEDCAVDFPHSAVVVLEQGGGATACARCVPTATLGLGLLIVGGGVIGADKLRQNRLGLLRHSISFGV